MGKKKTIEIRGKEYPARMTMGALRRYRQKTGEEVAQMGNDPSKMGTLMYCCTASACNADGIELPYDEETFLDLVDVGQAETFAESISDGQDDEKKREEAPVLLS